MEEEKSEVSVVFVPPLGAGPEMVLQSLVSLSCEGIKIRYAAINPHGRIANDFLGKRAGKISGPEAVDAKRDGKEIPAA